MTLPPPGAPPSRAETARTALALGMVGALGEALLATLVSSERYRLTHVAVDQQIGSGSPRFRPWIIGDGVVTADDAYVCLTPTDFHSTSPLRRFAVGEAAAAAQLARECGVSRLIVVSPLAALLQLNAGAHVIGSGDELAITHMGFASVLLVRPSAEDRDTDGNWSRGLLRAATRALRDIMLPQKVQPLRAQTAANAIIEAARRAPGGVHVLGAAALATIVEQLRSVAR